MAYKLFVDSDIFLDILLIREPHFSDSVSILHLRAEYKVELYTSPTIILNTNYIAQKQNNRAKALKGIAEILKTVEIIEATKEILVNSFLTCPPVTNLKRLRLVISLLWTKTSKFVALTAFYVTCKSCKNSFWFKRCSNYLLSESQTKNI